MTARATRFVGPDHLRGDHPAARHHRSVRSRHERRHRAHRAGVDDRSAAGRAGDRQHHRQVRQRHRRRFPVHALYRHAGAGAGGAGDEHADVRARGGPARTSTRSPRAACGSSSRARAIWRAAGLARGGWPSRTRSSPRRRRSCGREGPLRGQRVLVTAGPTYEDFDPVRYIGNRSSGRMGFAIAAEATRRGAEVTLVAGPTTGRAAGRCARSSRCARAAEMHEAVMARADDMDVVVMAAAVADYTPAERAAQKVPKGGETLTLVLKKTPDILAELGRRRWRRAAVRCWSGSPRKPRTSSRARRRSAWQKHVDLIVANDVSRSDAGFDVDTNDVTIVGPHGAEALPLQRRRAWRRRSSIASSRLLVRSRPDQGRDRLIRGPRSDSRSTSIVRRRTRRRDGV